MTQVQVATGSVNAASTQTYAKDANVYADSANNTHNTNGEVRFTPTTTSSGDVDDDMHNILAVPDDQLLPEVAGPDDGEDDVADRTTSTSTRATSTPTRTPTPVTSTLPADYDLIYAYVAYADRFEMPAIMHEALATTVIAAIGNGKVWAKMDGELISLDLWTAVVSRSSMGRNRTMREMWKVLKAAGLQDIIHSEDFGSREQMSEYLSKHPRSFYFWPEMSHNMEQLQKWGMKPWFTNLYDETMPPPAKHFRSKMDEDGDEVPGNTPSIEFTVAPRTNVFASSSMRWFMESMTDKDAMGGLTPRWCLFIADGEHKLVPRVLAADASLLPNIGHRLQEISKLEGVMDWGELLGEEWQTWYISTYQRFASHSNSDLILPFFSRMRSYVLKLATVFAMAESGTLTPTLAAFNRAVALVRKMEEFITTRLGPSGFSKEGNEMWKLESGPREAGSDGQKWHEFMEANKATYGQHLSDRLHRSIESNTLSVYSRSGSGRPGLVVVHAQHQAAFLSKYRGKTTAVAWEIIGKKFKT